MDYVVQKDFPLYKPRLKEYLQLKGVEIHADGNAHCFNPGGHKNGDANPSLQLFDDSFKCHGCGIQGDIYDAVEILEGITGKKEQFEFVEKLFGGGVNVKPIAPSKAPEIKSGDNFTADGEAVKLFEAYLRKHKSAAKMIKQFLDSRAAASTNNTVQSYPPDVEAFLIERLFYWAGLDVARKDLGADTLKKCGIPLINPKTDHSTWEHSGVVMNLGTGYKLNFYEKRYCQNCGDKGACKKEPYEKCCLTSEKRTSKGGKTFPMPGAIDKTKPVILVEGEMDALSCAAIGIKNVFAAGGTNGVTGPKVKQFLMAVPEIILFFDADEAGRKASGLETLGGNDKRKSNLPQIILKAGYTGKIYIAALPPMAETGYKDQDALITAGKRDAVLQALAEAKEYESPTVTDAEEKIDKNHDIQYPDLSLRRLKCLLRKVQREKLEITEIQPFVSACIKAFENGNTIPLLKEWGATAQEIRDKNKTEPLFLMGIAEKYLSRYLQKQMRCELTSAADIYKKIIVQNIPIEIDYDELEINENARKFAFYGGVRSGALTLADIFDGNIIYDAAKNVKKFYFFNGHVWRHEPDITGVIYNTLLRVIYRFMNLINEGDGDDKEKKKERGKIVDTLNKLETRRLRTEIQQEFGGLKDDGVYHNSDDRDDALHFDGDAIRETLTLQDVVMDFTGETIVFRKSRPQEFRREVLPYKVDEIKNSLFPKQFMEFMKGNFKDPDTLNTLMYYISLIPSRTQYKYGAFWIGGKNTGKSTTIRILEHIYQYLIGSMDADVLVPKGKTFATGQGPTPYIAQLQGLGASVISETEYGAILNVGLWKKLTGDDTISARGLNEAPKTFRNTAQIIISTNELPKFDRHDGSVITRMIVIPFLISHERDSKETKQWEDLLKELKPEFPAVIKLMAEYYIKLKNEHNGRIQISKESEAHKMGYIAEVESDLDKYINNCVTFEAGAHEIIKKVYQSYISYYDFDENSGRRGESLSQHRFTRSILKNYKDKVSETVQWVKEENKSMRCFVGLKLKPENEIGKVKSGAEYTAAEETWNTRIETQTTQQTEPETEENPFG